MQIKGARPNKSKLFGVRDRRPQNRTENRAGTQLYIVVGSDQMDATRIVPLVDTALANYL